MTWPNLATKPGFMAGNLEKFGILPILVALAIQLKAFAAQLGDTPLWQIGLATVDEIRREQRQGSALISRRELVAGDQHAFQRFIDVARMAQVSA